LSLAVCGCVARICTCWAGGYVEGSVLAGTGAWKEVAAVAWFTCMFTLAGTFDCWGTADCYWKLTTSDCIYCAVKVGASCCNIAICCGFRPGICGGRFVATLGC